MGTIYLTVQGPIHVGRSTERHCHDSELAAMGSQISGLSGIPAKEAPQSFLITLDAPLPGLHAIESVSLQTGGSGGHREPASNTGWNTASRSRPSTTRECSCCSAEQKPSLSLTSIALPDRSRIHHGYLTHGYLTLQSPATKLKFVTLPRLCCTQWRSRWPRQWHTPRNKTGSSGSNPRKKHYGSPHRNLL